MLFLFNSISLFSQENNYRYVFHEDYAQAVISIKRIRPTLKKECDYFKVDPKLAEAIVFPELIRISILKEKIESAGLALFYVNYGKAYSNFSAGIFQMKPSFIEELEKFAEENKRLIGSSHIFAYAANLDDKAMRKSRVVRIFSIEWQCRYVALFIKVLKQKFPIAEMIISERVLFCSSAYNYGFNKQYNEINRAKTLHLFPYGIFSPFKQYSYADISLWYYNQEENE